MEYVPLDNLKDILDNDVRERDFEEKLNHYGEEELDQ